ncbi:MAG TPA: tail protein X [Polyangiaceae bacterium]|nr:tail protein X [Polyangiaceae bacterium]
MTEYVRYTTSDGDRWDSIAQAHYGDPWAFGPIIAANPRVPIRPVLSGGIELLIPVRPAESTTADVSQLPPWKRGGR